MKKALGFGILLGLAALFIYISSQAVGFKFTMAVIAGSIALAMLLDVAIEWIIGDCND